MGVPRCVNDPGDTLKAHQPGASRVSTGRGPVVARLLECLSVEAVNFTDAVGYLLELGVMLRLGCLCFFAVLVEVYHLMTHRGREDESAPDQDFRYSYFCFSGPAVPDHVREAVTVSLDVEFYLPGRRKI